MPEQDSTQVSLRVRKADPEAALRVGEVWAIRDGEQVLGRAADADICISSETVSRQHARLILRDGALWVEPLTTTNGTFLNGEPVPCGDPTPVGGEQPILQLGGVLLEVLVDHRTRPVLAALTLDDQPTSPHDGAQPMLIVRWDTTKCSIQCRGRTLDLAPNAARALSALCAQPGQPVHHWDIQDEVGAPCNVAQLISAVRRSFRLLVDQQVLTLDEIRALVSTHSSGNHLEGLADMDINEVLRCFVMSRRGHGYLICLATTDVRIEQ